MDQQRQSGRFLGAGSESGDSGRYVSVYFADKGIDGFKRYIALAVVARNIHRIGDILWKRKQARQQRQQRKAQNAQLYEQAA